MIISAEHNPCAVRQAPTARFDTVSHLRELRELSSVLRYILISRCQMRCEDVYIEAVEHCRIHLFGSDAQPVDTAVQHHMAPPSPAILPPGNLIRRVQERDCAELSGKGNIAVGHAVEHRNLGRRNNIGDGCCLCPVRNKEILTFGFR